MSQIHSSLALIINTYVTVLVCILFVFATKHNNRIFWYRPIHVKETLSLPLTILTAAVIAEAVRLQIVAAPQFEHLTSAVNFVYPYPGINSSRASSLG